MIIGLDDTLEGRSLITEICVINNFKIVVETITVRTLIDSIDYIVIARERIEKLLLIAYPDATLVRENYKPLTNIQADAKETKIIRKTNSMLS